MQAGKVWTVERCKAKLPLAVEVAQRVSWANVGMDFGIGYTRGAPPMCPTSQIHCHTHLFLHIPKAISVQPI